MGLGELLGGLIGSNDGTQRAAEETGISGRVISAGVAAVKKLTGVNPTPEREKSIKKRGKELLELAMSVTPWKPVNDVVIKVDENDGDVVAAAGDIADSMMAAIQGRVAEIQLEQMLGIKIDGKTPVTRRLSDQMGLITNTSLAAATTAIVAEVASLGQIDAVGNEIRSYLDYSGLSQITGYGYGLIVSTALESQVKYEINAQTQHVALDPGMLATLYVRGVIGSEVYHEEMAKHGYSAEKSEDIVKALSFYPSGNDFISFAVRDAFNPEIVRSAGLDDNFPDEIIPLAAKAGMSEEVLRWYWRAHWQLPSPQMGYDMLQRGIITVDELKALLRAADWAPGWIDRLIAISYNPLTRVDARRMWESGVLNDEEYVQSMRDIGYSEENARRYLAWVKVDSTSAEKDLTKTEILGSFRYGLISREEAINYILGFGYDEQEADLIISLEEQKHADKVLDDNIDLIKWQFTHFEIEEEEFFEKMGKLGLNRAASTKYLAEAENTIAKTGKLPTLADVKNWMKRGIITEAEARNYLKRLQYRKAEQDRYMEEWKQ
jgi:hypothetical protein